MSRAAKFRSERDALAVIRRAIDEGRMEQNFASPRDFRLFGEPAGFQLRLGQVCDFVVCRACDDEHPLIYFVNQPGGAAVLHRFRPAARR